jgi:hypothetical protein
MSQNLSSAIAAIGIDIGKNSFHVVGLDARGAILLRQKWSRGQRRPASEHAAVFDRHGGVCWRASPQSQAQGVWSRRAADAGEVCAPLF